jgi:hypothetical protein
VSEKWHGILDPEVLAIPADSVCGVEIVTMCKAADALLPSMVEPDGEEAVLNAVKRQADVILFG